MKTSELILYRNFKHSDILEDMCSIEEDSGNSELAYVTAGKLVTLAGEYGFAGNIWHCFLSYLLVNNENAFSTACEMKGKVAGTINSIALHDFGVFKKLFEIDLVKLDKSTGTECFSALEDYEPVNDIGSTFNKRIRDRICGLSESLAKAESAKEYLNIMTKFYKEYGVGKFGLHKAFRIEEISDGKAAISPITKIAHVSLDDLVGYEDAKKKLIDNTEAFIDGRPANNCLLFGDAGTGKSSSIKGILNKYYDRGLRIIEVYKHQFRYLNEVIAQIKNRNYRFIIYMDDLSFEDFEIEYKYLKAVIEGGLEKRPDNILIYATSNRRHLIHEGFRDKLDRNEDDDIHKSDTVQEKLSLSSRFGVTIYFGSPSHEEFRNIVLELAKRSNVSVSEEVLLAEANKWELSHGGLSGRTARQFIDYLLGIETEAEVSNKRNR